MAKALPQLAQCEELAHAAKYRANLFARLCNTSPRHMRRRIRSLLGESLQRWLDQLRLARAKELLPYTMSIKELSYFLAYKKPSHFSRHFKSHVGLTPSQFIAAQESKRTHLEP